MRYLLVGGGTAGHINPAIAIAQAIQQHEPDAVIRFVGTPSGMEARLVPQAGFDYVTIPSSGFRRNFKLKSIVHNLQTLGHLALANPRANKIMRDFRPDVVIGTGGYVTGAVVLAGVRYGAKTVIHEQNAYPGVTNKLLAKKVNKVLLAVEEAKPRMECRADFAVVGNPIRESVITKTRQEARQELGITDDRLVVLSFGGSLGARIINRMAADLMDHNRKGLYRHIHGYGQQGRALPPILAGAEGGSVQYGLGPRHRVHHRHGRLFGGRRFGDLPQRRHHPQRIAGGGESQHSGAQSLCGGKPPIPQCYGAGQPRRS